VGARRWLAVTVILAAALAAGCVGAPRAGHSSAPATAAKAAGQRPATLLAAGDIASCASEGDEQTAALLDTLPGTVLTLGDTVYEDGSAVQFPRCYAPSWGRFRDRTYPAPGNHDYHTVGASGYYGFFGPRAGQRGEGWYSFDLGRWHLVALNSAATRLAAASPVRSKSAGCEPTWQPTPPAARWRSGTTRVSVPAPPTAATRPWAVCGWRCTRPAPTSCWWDTSTTMSASPRSTPSAGSTPPGGCGSSSWVPAATATTR